MNGTRQTLPIDSICLDLALQVRAEVNREAIDRFVADLAAGEVLPPVIVFREEETATRWLADGFRRIAAARKLGRTEIEAIVIQGSWQDALLYAVAANTRHGEGRSPADTERAVGLLLANPAFAHESNYRVAQLCRTSEKTVRRVKARLRQRGVLSAAPPQMEVIVHRGNSVFLQRQPDRRDCKDKLTREPSPAVPPVAEEPAAEPPPAAEHIPDPPPPPAAESAPIIVHVAVAEKPAAESPPPPLAREPARVVIPEEYRSPFRAILVSRVWGNSFAARAHQLPICELAAPTSMLLVWTGSVHLQGNRIKMGDLRGMA